MEALGKASQEVDFLAAVLKDDNKNYHAWSYRIWLCQAFNLYEQEL